MRYVKSAEEQLGLNYVGKLQGRKGTHWSHYGLHKVGGKKGMKDLSRVKIMK